MNARCLICSFLLLSAPSSWANVVRYQGVARNGDRTVYIEQHAVTYNDKGELQSATTEYLSPSGKPIAEMKSDFTTSVTVPTHVMTDLRSGEVQGLRRDGNKVVMYLKEKDKPEQSRVLSADDGRDRVLVGCQGLNYYLLQNLGSFAAGQRLPLRFLIPGKLDYYDFDMKPIGEIQGEQVEFEIKVKDWYLKLFAPTLRVKYDRGKERIVWYEGISNIMGEDGGNQKVTINYTYE